jgi:hypothetical protein
MCDDKVHLRSVAALVVFDLTKMILAAKALATCSVKCLAVAAADGIRQAHSVVATLKQHCHSVLLKR